MGAGKSTFTFSHSSITVNGGSTTIIITCNDQSYSHKLFDAHGEIATLAAGTTSYTYAPTANSLTKFFQEVPAQKSRLIDIYLDTYDGTTKIGRDAHSLTVTLSEDAGKPEVSDFTITDANTTAHGWGIIVYGKSSLTATATSVGQYGATISRNVFTCDHNDKHYEASDVNDLIASLPLTNTPASFTLGYKSTDSRGFSSTVTLSKSIAGYQAPHIDTFEVIRCDESGTESDTGTKAKVVVNGSWTAMKDGSVYKNPAVLKIGHKAKADTSYVYQTIVVSDSVVNVSQILSAALDTSTEYEFSVQFTDSFETYSETGVGCSNVKNILYVSADGNEMVIGTDTGHNVSIDSDSVDIRDGSKVLANFSESAINLGINSSNSGISMCGGIGSIRAQDILGTGKYHELDISCKDGVSISTKYNDAWISVQPKNAAGGANNYGVYINNLLYTDYLADWVVAEGTSGDWTYRKYASGAAECWLTKGHVWLFKQGGTFTNFTLPFTFANHDYTVYSSIEPYNVTSFFNNIHLIPDTKTTTTLRMWAWFDVDASYDYKVNVKVIGRWK